VVRDDNRTSAIDPSKLGRIAASAALVLGFLSYAFFELKIAPLRGLWYDEYWSLYTADLHAGTAVLLSDINTPFYYLLLRATLLTGLSGALALAAVNQFAIVSFSAVALWLFARSGRFWFGLAAIGITLATPTVLTYGLEGRFYALAQFSCFALAAAVLTRLDAGPRKYDLALFIVLALIVSASHLFGALFAGSIGGAMMLVSLRTSRQDVVLGFGVGALAIVVAAAWVMVAHAAMFEAGGLAEWIPQGASWILGQFWFMNRLLSGLTPNVVLLAGAVVCCGFALNARQNALLVALTAMLFFGLPVLASAWQPIVTGRYLTIGAPALTLMVTFMGWRAFETQTSLARVGAALAAGFLLIAVSSAPTVAHRMTWVGRWPYDAAGARAGVAGCASPRVRVYIPAEGIRGAVHMFSYEQALAQPDVSLVSSRRPSEDVAAYPCKLIGWGEQVFFSLPNMSDAEVLQQLGLTNTEGARLHVERRSYGLLILRD
jgi:hypothetical protein